MYKAIFLTNNILNIKILLILLLSVSLSLNSFSQEENEDDLEFKSLKKDKGSKDKNMFNEDADFSVFKFKISLLFPSLGMEFKLAEKASIEVSGKLNFQLYITGTQAQPKVNMFPYSVLHLEPKWNYNVKNRIRRGRKVSGFSSNFLSLFTSYRMKVSRYTFSSLIIGPTWGMQRQLGKYGYLKFNSGLGYTHIFDSRIRRAFLRQSNIPIPIGLIVDFQIGFMF